MKITGVVNRGICGVTYPLTKKILLFIENVFELKTG